MMDRPQGHVESTGRRLPEGVWAWQQQHRQGLSAQAPATAGQNKKMPPSLSLWPPEAETSLFSSISCTPVRLPLPGRQLSTRTTPAPEPPAENPQHQLNLSPFVPMGGSVKQRRQLWITLPTTGKHSGLSHLLTAGYGWGENTFINR